MSTPRDSSADAPLIRDVRLLRVLPESTLITWRGIEVRAGGWGSDLALDPSSSDHLYLLADRGPNFDAPGMAVKGFAKPDFIPRIGRFRIGSNSLELERIIEIRAPDGSPTSGLPNPPGPGSTGETAVNLEGAVLAADTQGLDPEGLVALGDDGFWLAEEYGPSLIRLDGSGTERSRHSPFAGSPPLPAVLARRRPNRGFEGLALLNDGRTLCAILQSSLDNPDVSARSASRWARVVLLDAFDGTARQLLYEQDEPANSLSGVAALPDGDLLVIEHDALMPGDAARPSTCKRVYRLSLDGASDVTGDPRHPAGLMLGGLAPEVHSRQELAAHGVVPMRKRLVLDLLALGYPHDKPEGLAVMDERTVAIVNDDDFGVVSDGSGGIVAKRLAMSGERDCTELWTVKLEATLF